jgi:hypothetical protein
VNQAHFQHTFERPKYTSLRVFRQTIVGVLERKGGEPHDPEVVRGEDVRPPDDLFEVRQRVHFH